MLPEVGSLVYVNGNEAAIVIGYGVGADGAQDGSVIVGTFSGSQQFEAGHYGAQPGLAGENPPSFIPETHTVAPVAATGPVLPTAGGTPVSEVAGDAPASVVQTSEQASSGAPIELSGPAVPGSTDVDFEAANGVDRETQQNARIAELERELAATRGTVVPGGFDDPAPDLGPQIGGDSAAEGAAQPTTTTSDAAQPPAGTTPPDSGSHAGL